MGNSKSAPNQLARRAHRNSEEMTDEDLLEAQVGLEAESRAIGASRYQRKRGADWIDAFGPLADEASLPPGRQVLRRALLPTSDAIIAFLEAGRSGKAGRRHSAHTLLDQHEIDPRAIAYLTLRCAIQAGVQELRAQRAGKMVARAIMDHIEGVEFAKVNPKGAAGLQRNLAKRAMVSRKRQQAISALHLAEGIGLDWSDAEQVQVGMKLIELAAEATGLFELRMIQTRVGQSFRREQRLQMTQVAVDWLDRQHKRCELLDPLPLPMVVIPRQWTSPTDGGYLRPPIGNRLIHARTPAYHQELEHMDIRSICRAVNAVQETRWRINCPLLDVLERLVDEGGRLAGLPQRDAEPVPSLPVELAGDEDAIKRFKEKQAAVHARNAAGRNKRLQIAQQLWVARKLRDYPAIFFPHHLDWRGRVYPTPQGGPHPQAGDIGRSLLEFADGKPLGAAGARWLAIHVANTFGQGKIGFDERVAWVAANQQQILDSASDPLDGSRFWATADKPWAALAACLEWAGYVAEGEAFKSHLPIAIDGSNSGLQHLTALLRDDSAAPHVNLQAADRPGDIYAVVAAEAQRIVDASDDPAAVPWKGARITRRVVKRPCMTYVYSATKRAMADQIRAELAELDRAANERGGEPYLRGHDNFLAGSWLANMLFKLIGDTVPAARTAMAWLKSAAKAVSNLDVPLWWTTPAGLPVLQRYPQTKPQTVNVTFRKQRLQLQLHDDAGRNSLGEWTGAGGVRSMDARRAIDGIAPNFVHSLDAAHLMMTVTAAKDAGITDVAVIHDSFATHASNMDGLSGLLRRTFIDLYKSDPLLAFRNEALDQIQSLGGSPDLLPPLPLTGSLDLRSIEDAAYMFA